MGFDISANNGFTWECEFGLTLEFRSFTADEREAFDADFITFSNRPEPKGLPKAEKDRRTVLRRRAIYKKVAGQLLTGWKGVDDGGKPLPFSDEAKKRFLDNPETRRFWVPAIVEYLYPTGRNVDAAEVAEQEVPFQPGS